MKNYILIICIIIVIPIIFIILSPRTVLVEVRNFFINEKFIKLDEINPQINNIKFIKDKFKNKLNSFEDFYDYRKGRLRNKAFSNEIIFNEKVDDCFGNNNKGYMCGCSDISEIILAFCSTKNNNCFEVVNSSGHSIVYNKTTNTVIDLFYGYYFEGTISELIELAKKKKISKSRKFHIIGGKYIAADIDLNNLDNKNNKINYDFTVNKLNDVEIEFIESNYSYLFKSWDDYILESLGNDANKLLIQRGQYYWTGNEFFYPLLVHIRTVNDNLYRAVKEILGYFYNYK